MMNETSGTLEQNLKRSEQHARQHWFEDGLAELAVGLYFLLLGALYFADWRMAGVPLSGVGLPLITLCGVFLLAPLVQRAKLRLTSTRSGYVSFRQPPLRQRTFALGIGLAAGMLLGVGAAWLFGSSRLPWGQDSLVDWTRWLPLAQGVVLAAILALMAYRLTSTRLTLLALLALVTGLLLSLLALDTTLSTALFFTVMGAALMLSGGVALARFLRRTRPFDEDGAL